MALSYFNVKKLRRQSKQADNTGEPLTSPPPAPIVSTPSEEPAASPILDDEDQKFLERLALIAQEPEGTPPPLPTRPTESAEDGETKAGKDPQEAILDGAQKVPLPMSPSEVNTEEPGKDASKSKDGLGRKKSVMSYFSLAQTKFKQATEKDKAKEKEKGKEKEKKSKDAQDSKKEKLTEKDRKVLADDLLAAAAVAKTAEQKEAAKEEADLTAILEELNLSAVNNRVFSFSKESEELFAKFKLVLTDIINGAPTAYNDLEKLFTEYDTQLKKMYGNLPPFLQNMVKSLPAKMTATLGPELMAASSEKPGFDAKQASGAAGKAKFKMPKVPSLKNLLSAEGAVAAMLRSILNFLKLRFPAVLTGTNVLMSLAVCLLLFVFWYCHKRGRETRLERERAAAEEGESGLASSAASITDDNDSIFGSKKKIEGESSSSDSPAKASTVQESATKIEDMPSVKDLPEPGKGKEKA
ncbi:hypothetical protein DM02DRAFT_608915 [Periconia macrospinosa]|uniref:Uncharacterized protein n=1 Tax=Periconia macrospinosa TaxID=97972 RepID=A0A2V1EB39_9PLEO|nr:hypothetical protein DM02DRAFT_608915 [Periconia macrospinosa]